MATIQSYHSVKFSAAVVGLLSLFSCVERSQEEGDGSAPPVARPPATSPAVFDGVATQMPWVAVQTRGYDIYRPGAPRIFIVGIEYEADAGVVTFPRKCMFPVAKAKSVIEAVDEDCLFPEDSNRPNEEIRSQRVHGFRFDLETTRFVHSTTSERRIVEGEYGQTYEVLQGVLDQGEVLLKHPPGTVGFEFEGAFLRTFQPKSLEDDSGCAEKWQFTSESAAGILFSEPSGEVVLSGWGCSSDLRGTAKEPVQCEYQLDLPDAVPRLWLSQLEVSESGFLMRGELRGSDYRYCLEVESETVKRL